MHEVVEVSSEIFLGNRGRIKLEAAPDRLPENRTAYKEGFHLVRLALFRDFGGETLKRFDSSHFNALQAGNAMTLDTLKKFVHQEGEKHEASIYLSSVYSFEETLNIVKLIIVNKRTD